MTASDGTAFFGQNQSRTRPPVVNPSARVIPNGLQATGHRFKLEPLSSITPPSIAAWHIRDLLPATGLSVIYGPPGSGKSFIALHAALCLASGREFAGRKPRSTGVVYIAAEASEGFRRRVVAARGYLGISDAPFAMISAAPHLGTADKDIGTLISDVRSQSKDLGWSPGVVVVDTLARTIPGLDENSASEMGVFVANCEKLTRELGCTVIAVHHSGKNVESGMRGSSALHGAADAEWCVSVEGGVRTVRLVKSKEGADNLSFSFELDVIEVGADEDGAPVTTCVVAGVTEVQCGDVTRGPEATTRIPAGLKLFMLAFENVSIAHSVTLKPFLDGPEVRAVDIEAVRTEFYSRHPAESAEAKRQAFYRNQKTAAERRLLHFIEKSGKSWLWRG